MNLKGKDFLKLLDFSSEEIIKSVELLDIKSGEEAWKIFFTKEVENNSTK